MINQTHTERERERERIQHDQSNTHTHREEEEEEEYRCVIEAASFSEKVTFLGLFSAIGNPKLLQNAKPSIEEEIDRGFIVSCKVTQVKCFSPLI